MQTLREVDFSNYGKGLRALVIAHKDYRKGETKLMHEIEDKRKQKQKVIDEKVLATILPARRA